MAFFIIVIVVGGLIAGASWIALRAAGADPATARRLAGPRQVKVGDLLAGGQLPGRAVRVIGRIRCRDPLDAGDGERLVAFHRDVEAKIGTRWQTLERLRETRSFDLWDHGGSLRVDPAMAAEPMIVIPSVWRGDPAELEEPHASALARLTGRGPSATAARAIVRGINVTDRVMVVARASRGSDGAVHLEPPASGYLVTNLDLPDAMRLLGGTNRRLASAGMVGVAIGTVGLAVGGIGAVLAAILAG